MNRRIAKADAWHTDAAIVPASNPFLARFPAPAGYVHGLMQGEGHIYGDEDNLPVVLENTGENTDVVRAWSEYGYRPRVRMLGGPSADRFTALPVYPCDLAVYVREHVYLQLFSDADGGDRWMMEPNCLYAISFSDIPAAQLVEKDGRVAQLVGVYQFVKGIDGKDDVLRFKPGREATLAEILAEADDILLQIRDVGQAADAIGRAAYPIGDYLDRLVALHEFGAAEAQMEQDFQELVAHLEALPVDTEAHIVSANLAWLLDLLPGITRPDRDAQLINALSRAEKHWGWDDEVGDLIAQVMGVLFPGAALPPLPTPHPKPKPKANPFENPPLDFTPGKPDWLDGGSDGEEDPDTR